MEDFGTEEQEENLTRRRRRCKKRKASVPVNISKIERAMEEKKSGIHTIQGIIESRRNYKLLNGLFFLSRALMGFCFKCFVVL